MGISQEKEEGQYTYIIYKGLNGKARIPMDDLIHKTRRCRNQHSLSFQIPPVSKDAYKYSFFPPDYQGLE